MRDWIAARFATWAYMRGYREGFHGAEKALHELQTLHSREEPQT